MGRNQNNIDWGGWILTIIMLGAFWPVGLFLLFRQVMGYSKQKGRVKRHPYDIQREQQTQGQGQAQGQYRYTVNQNQPRSQGSVQAQYQQTQWYARQEQEKQAQQAQRQYVPQGGGRPAAEAAKGGWSSVKNTTAAVPGRKEKRAGRALTIVGGILTGIFGLAILTTIGEWWGYWSVLARDLFPLMGFFGAGLVCLFTGHRQRKQAKRYKKYLAYIGKNQEISIAALASAMGVKVKTVYEDLQDMLDDGVLPMGYIDVAEGMLVLSDRGIHSEPVRQVQPEPESEPEPVKKTVEDENAILQEIREVNDAIPDEVMSAKIDRIGEITGKILDYQRSHPSKSGQLRSFLNYYLPTTLKILRAYARLDAQGIEGENISAAKKRIENMTDQVVDGFEKQLDKLFADDALDITSDVQVLENMLRKDGLADGGMTLSAGPAAEPGGGISAQQAYLDLKKVADELEAQSRDKGDGQITLQL